MKDQIIERLRKQLGHPEEVAVEAKVEEDFVEEVEGTPVTQPNLLFAIYKELKEINRKARN